LLGLLLSASVESATTPAHYHNDFPAHQSLFFNDPL
jgi:hypothetical protein